MYAALVATSQPNRRLDAFANCGSSLWLHRDGDELALTSNACHDRLCIPCQVARRARLVETILVRVAEATDRVRHVTLTLKCQPVSLAAQLDRLTASFRRLRHRKFWASHVVGGAAFLEVKLGKNSHDWHAHLHILCEGSFIDQRTLCEEWHAVTGDSFITYIEPLGDPRRRALYVTKYATKPIDRTVISSTDHLQEAVCALKGRRLFQCFGTWDGFADDDADATPRRCLTSIGPLTQLFSDARRGDVDARRWVDAALRKWPSLAESFGAPGTPTLEAPP